jgi:hypothetical protein
MPKIIFHSTEQSFFSKEEPDAIGLHDKNVKSAAHFKQLISSNMWKLMFNTIFVGNNTKTAKRHQVIYCAV